MVALALVGSFLLSLILGFAIAKKRTGCWAVSTVFVVAASCFWLTIYLNGVVWWGWVLAMNSVAFVAGGALPHFLRRY